MSSKSGKSTWSSSYIYAVLLGGVFGYLPDIPLWAVPAMGFVMILYDWLFKTWRWRMNRDEDGLSAPAIVINGTIFYTIFGLLGYGVGWLVSRF